MESVGRVTRSRAKSGVATTPHDQSKTPLNKSTRKTTRQGGRTDGHADQPTPKAALFKEESLEQQNSDNDTVQHTDVNPLEETETVLADQDAVDVLEMGNNLQSSAPVLTLDSLDPEQSRQGAASPLPLDLFTAASQSTLVSFPVSAEPSYEATRSSTPVADGETHMLGEMQGLCPVISVEQPVLASVQEEALPEAAIVSPPSMPSLQPNTAQTGLITPELETVDTADLEREASIGAVHLGVDECVGIGGAALHGVAGVQEFSAEPTVDLGFQAAAPSVDTSAPEEIEHTSYQEPAHDGQESTDNWMEDDIDLPPIDDEELFDEVPAETQPSLCVESDIQDCEAAAPAALHLSTPGVHFDAEMTDSSLEEPAPGVDPLCPATISSEGFNLALQADEQESNLVYLPVSDAYSKEPAMFDSSVEVEAALEAQDEYMEEETAGQTTLDPALFDVDESYVQVQEGIEGNDGVSRDGGLNQDTVVAPYQYNMNDSMDIVADILQSSPVPVKVSNELETSQDALNIVAQPIVPTGEVSSVAPLEAPKSPETSPVCKAGLKTPNPSSTAKIGFGSTAKRHVASAAIQPSTAHVRKGFSTPQHVSKTTVLSPPLTSLRKVAMVGVVGQQSTATEARATTPAKPAPTTAGKTATKRVSISTPGTGADKSTSRLIIKTPYPKSKSVPSSQANGTVADSQIENSVQSDTVSAHTGQDLGLATMEECEPGAQYDMKAKDVEKEEIVPAVSKQQSLKYKTADGVLKGYAQIKEAPAKADDKAAGKHDQGANGLPRYLAGTASSKQKTKFIEGEAGASIIAVAKPKVKSVVVVPSPNKYDARSLGEIRREIKKVSAKPVASKQFVPQKAAAKTVRAAVQAPGVDDLVGAMGSLDIKKVNKPLRGLPVPSGTHLRFTDSGEAVASPGYRKVVLRGVPVAQGKHTKFDD